MTPQERALNFKLLYTIPADRARAKVRIAFERMCKQDGIIPIVAYEQAVRRLERYERREECARRALLDAHDR